MSFKFALFFLLGLSLAFAAPNRRNLDELLDNNLLGGIPFLGGLGNAFGGDDGGDNQRNNSLSNIPFLGGFSNAIQEGIKGGQSVLQKGMDTGMTAAKTGLKVVTGFVPFKLPI